MDYKRMEEDGSADNTSSSNPAGPELPEPTPADGPPPTITQRVRDQMREKGRPRQYHCACCAQPFTYGGFDLGTKCPHCKKTNSVGNLPPKKQAAICVFAGILFLALSVGITVGTMELGAGFYFVWIAGFVIGIGLIVQGIVQTCRKQAVEVEQS